MPRLDLSFAGTVGRGLLRVHNAVTPPWFRIFPLSELAGLAFETVARNWTGETKSPWQPRYLAGSRGRLVGILIDHLAIEFCGTPCRHGQHQRCQKHQQDVTAARPLTRLSGWNDLAHRCSPKWFQEG